MSVSTDVLAERYRAAWDKTKRGREQWIEGTLELAVIISEARISYPNHREYSHWLTRNNLESISAQNRSALLCFARDLTYAQQLLEQSTSMSWQHIWAKQLKRTPSQLRKGPISRISGSSKRRRAAIIPDVMREDYVPAPPRIERLSEKFLTPEQVDPDFKGTPLEFTTEYGHVLLHTKDEIQKDKRQDTLQAWLKTVAAFAAASRPVLPALANVEPTTLQEWLGSRGKAEKLKGWVKEIQAACAALEALGSPLVR
jgi:hypothetical protein